MSFLWGMPIESQIFSLNWSNDKSSSSCEMKYPLSATISFTVLYALHKRDVVLSASSIVVVCEFRYFRCSSLASRFFFLLPSPLLQLLHMEKHVLKSVAQKKKICENENFLLFLTFSCFFTHNLSITIIITTVLRSSCGRKSRCLRPVSRHEP